MTSEEAIQILNGIEEVRGDLPEDGLKIDEALIRAKEALEKQIPKKPQEGNVHIVYLCPNCHSLDYTIPYCRYCGQHLSFKEV